MSNLCSMCGEKVRSGNKFCSKQCSDTHKLQEKMKEVIDLKKEIASLKQRIAEQDNLWENMIGDVIEDSISPAHIRWWTNKLITDYNICNENKMLGWLGGVADILDVYTHAKNSKETA